MFFVGVPSEEPEIFPEKQKFYKFHFLHVPEILEIFGKNDGVFSVIFPPAQYFPPVEAVAAVTSVFTEYVFCESVDSAHNSQISIPSKKLTAC